MSARLNRLAVGLWADLKERLDKRQDLPAWAPEAIEAMAAGEMTLPADVLVPEAYAWETWPVAQLIYACAGDLPRAHEEDDDEIVAQWALRETLLRSLIRQTRSARAEIQEQLYGRAEPWPGKPGDEPPMWWTDWQRDMVYALTCCDPVWLRGYQIWIEEGGLPLSQAEADGALEQALKRPLTSNVRLAMALGADPDVEIREKPALGVAQTAAQVEVLLRYGANPQKPSSTGVYAEDEWVQRSSDDRESVLAWFHQAGPHPAPLDRIETVLVHLDDAEWKRRWQVAHQPVPASTDTRNGRSFYEWFMLGLWNKVLNNSDQWDVLYACCVGQGTAWVHPQWQKDWIHEQASGAATLREWTPWQRALMWSHEQAPAEFQDLTSAEWQDLILWWQNLPPEVDKKGDLGLPFVLKWLASPEMEGSPVRENELWLTTLETMASAKCSMDKASWFWPQALSSLSVNLAHLLQSPDQEQRLGLVVGKALRTMREDRASVAAQFLLPWLERVLKTADKTWVRILASVDDSVLNLAMLDNLSSLLKEPRIALEGKIQAHRRIHCLEQMAPGPASPSRRRLRG